MSALKNYQQVSTKGSDVYTADGVNDPRVVLSVLLVQGCDNTVTSYLDTIIATGNKAMLEDAFVLLFQTRDIRGGKGIRDATLILQRHFLNSYKTRTVMLDLLAFIPEYGSWRDLKCFAIECVVVEDVVDHILSLFHKQLLKDMVSKTGPSLAAKYAPRECHKNATEKLLANELARRMFTGNNSFRKYRQFVSALNNKIDTTEVKMCNRLFAEIEPAKVPGRCLQKNMKAFLNQPSAYKQCHLWSSLPVLRPSTDPDRVECAEHFTEFLIKAVKGEVKLNGSKTVFPHELIKKIVKQPELSDEEKNGIVAVWNEMVKDAKAGGGLGRSVAMCDFSGSMQSSETNGDTPYWVSMALGLLISEVTTMEFEDTFLTFDSRPQFHRLPKGDIFARVASITDHLGQGTSTDFQKAMDLVLLRCKQQRVKPGEEPEYLIVLTDMNWDRACSSSEISLYSGNSYRHVVKTDPWQTHVEMIRESFRRAGEDMWGSKADGGLGGWMMPTIVIWNIAAGSVDFHAKADTEGVVMLSGWSPSLFKVLQMEGIVQLTPYQALRAQLDDPRYDPVREIVRMRLGP